jgi:hypothetical protein
VIQLRGAEPVTLKTGEGFYEGPNNVHIVGRNASDTKPAKFVVLLVTTSPNKGPATNPAAHTMTVRSLSPGIRPPDASSTNWLSAALRALQVLRPESYPDWTRPAYSPSSCRLSLRHRILRESYS